MMRNKAPDTPIRIWIPGCSTGEDDLTSMCFFTLDRRGNIVALNKAAGKLLGFPVKWLHGRPLLAFISTKHVCGFLDLLIRSTKILGHQETTELNLSIGGRSI